MASAQQLPPPGTNTVQENLRLFIDNGLTVLARVAPAFAGLLSQPKVLSRFHAMVGGDPAFGTVATGDLEQADQQAARDPDPGHGGPRHAGPRGLPEMLTAYLEAEQELGRLDPAADIGAASTLIIGAIHGQVLPRVLFSPPGSPITTPPGLANQLAETILAGIAPGARRI
jgi:hypothetical protein